VSDRWRVWVSPGGSGRLVVLLALDGEQLVVLLVQAVAAVAAAGVAVVHLHRGIGVQTAGTGRF